MLENPNSCMVRSNVTIQTTGTISRKDRSTLRNPQRLHVEHPNRMKIKSVPYGNIGSSAEMTEPTTKVVTNTVLALLVLGKLLPLPPVIAVRKSCQMLRTPRMPHYHRCNNVSAADNQQERLWRKAAKSSETNTQDTLIGDDRART